MQDTKYQVFTFSLSDNNINCNSSWSNKVQSEDRAEDIKKFRGEENQEMETVVHGSEKTKEENHELGLKEGRVLMNQ